MNSKLPRILAVVVAGLALSAAVTTFADDKPKKEKGPSKADLAKYDENKDGKLDEAEMAKMKADKAAARAAKKAEKKADADAKKPEKQN